MECHLVVQRRVRSINVHLVVRVIIMARGARLTDAVQLPTGQVILCFIPYMDRLVDAEVQYYIVWLYQERQFLKSGFRYY